MAATVTLPRGLALGGTRHREAEVRPLSGEDEAWLLDAAGPGLPVERVTEVLARCVTRLGPPGRVTPDEVRALTVGDREALLLHLRRASFGDRLPCVLRCPAPGCGEPLDLELRVQDLLLPAPEDAATEHEEAWEEDGRRHRARFRLPTGADHEAAAREALHGPEAGAGLLLRRCILSVETDGRPADEWPASLPARVERRMAELDPQAELLLDLDCPACGAPSRVLFDPASYLLAELAGQARQIYRQVHLLALHYHWSERDVLAMPPRRRLTYLRLLDEALSRRDPP